jgi:hypothetical protein
MTKISAYNGRPERVDSFGTDGRLYRRTIYTDNKPCTNSYYYGNDGTLNRIIRNDGRIIDISRNDKIGASIPVDCK